MLHAQSPHSRRHKLCPQHRESLAAAHPLHRNVVEEAGPSDTQMILRAQHQEQKCLIHTTANVTLLCYSV